MTNGEMGILMDCCLDKRAASATIWTNITKQGCSMTLDRQSITVNVQKILTNCKLVDIGKIRGYRHLAVFRSLEELPDQPYE